MITGKCLFSLTTDVIVLLKINVGSQIQTTVRCPSQRNRLRIQLVRSFFMLLHATNQQFFMFSTLSFNSQPAEEVPHKP